MTLTLENAFKPIQIGQLTLKHRIALAPLTRLRTIGETNVLIKDAAEYYSQRSERPGTLVITEATIISPRAGGYPKSPGIWNDEQVAAWKPVFEAIHKNGSYAYLQLWALGRQGDKQSIEKTGHDWVSASAIPVEEGGPAPRPLTIEEIQLYRKEYVAAAQRAFDAGVDGVEVHGANGYLLEQFLRESTNVRTDQYGGSIENRARFLLEVVDDIVKIFGADRVAVRLSPFSTFGNSGKGISTIPEYSYVLRELEKRAFDGKQLAFVHLVEPRVDGNVNVNGPLKESLEFAKHIWSGKLILAGQYGHDQSSIATAVQDDRTLVAIGRYFISNPDLVDRLEKGVELTKYNRDSFYSEGAKGYTDYAVATKA